MGTSRRPTLLEARAAWLLSRGPHPGLGDRLSEVRRRLAGALAVVQGAVTGPQVVSAACLFVAAAAGVVVVRRWEHEWMLPVGLWLYSAQAVYQVARHWAARGLSDLQWIPLQVLAISSSLVATWALGERRWILAATAVLPAVLAAVVMGKKWHDRSQGRRRPRGR